MKIDYPIPKKHSQETLIATKTNSSKSRLGLSFEEAINQSNDYYQQKNIAIIHKKPTPVQITKVSYPKRAAAKITEGYYKVPSTTDYNGIYRGFYIDFEAKQTKSTSFSFSHIYEHQVNHLDRIHRHGGIAFLLVNFDGKNETYLLDAPYLVQLYSDSKQGGRKSIAYKYFQEFAHLIEIKYTPRLDYLKTVDLVYFNGDKK